VREEKDRIGGEGRRRGEEEREGGEGRQKKDRRGGKEEERG
jgi:hypothetical protein